LEGAVGYYYAGEAQNLMTMLTSLCVATIIMIACGAAVGFFLQSKTQNRWTLFLAGTVAISVAAQALPALKPLIRKLSMFAPISAAHAADEASCKDVLTVAGGLRTIFNLDDKRYRVVVGSYKRPEEAAELAARVNKEDSSLRAFVGQPQPCNPYYAVVVSPYVSEQEARKVLERATQLKSVSGAFLSPYPNR
jgi:hypothetical protein